MGVPGGEVGHLPEGDFLVANSHFDAARVHTPVPGPRPSPRGIWYILRLKVCTVLTVVRFLSIANLGGKLKIAVLSMHPAPYRDPLFARIQLSLPDGLDVIHLYQATTHTEWNLPAPSYRSILLRAPVRLFGRIDFHLGILRLLHAGKYDAVVVPGHYPPASLAAAVFVLSSGKFLIYCSDAVSPARLSPGGWSIGRFLGSRAHAIWVPGSASRPGTRKGRLRGL